MADKTDDTTTWIVGLSCLAGDVTANYLDAPPLVSVPLLLVAGYCVLDVLMDDRRKAALVTPNTEPSARTVLRSRIAEVITAHEAGAMHFEIADAFRAEGYEVSGLDVRDAINAYNQAKAEDALRQDEQDRAVRAKVALTDLSAALRQTAS
ncbi:hypothetical protein D3093_33900 (plasmid) [Azospirillum argentinense]|uniref:Uncharacterized protein n=1 Tax=Azospirillum argentinense TaxID=2970906 RepID=A0A4D8PSC6_9PROT|nr:hypothetical protein [Azospirillum argentinense]QCO00235.1 hypothetical protein D3093_33900 [Azospirillum argentinense]